MINKHLVGTAAALGALVAGALTTAQPASADTDLFGHHTRHHGYVASEAVLSNEALARASRALVSSARAHGNQRVTMVVMDRSGVIRLVVRTVQAGPQTYESAKRKAYTAVAFGRPTSALAGNETVKQIPGTLVLPGGVPVLYQGFPIAGIGVGGAPDGRIDEAIADDVLAAVRG